MKRPLFILAILCAIQSFAQKPDLFVKKGDNGLYIEHKVTARENFYSVGRLYNVSAKGIAVYNKIDMNKGLNIDQKIRIPLVDTNFSNSGNKGTPVYYKAADDVSLQKISKDYGKASVEDLRYWNELQTDEIKKGQKLIIGFLKGYGLPVVTIDRPKDEKRVPTEEVVSKDDFEKEKKELEDAEKKQKENPSMKTVAEVKEVVPPVVNSEGYFKADFEKQTGIHPISKTEVVTSGVFKTTSGWHDGKYYLLIDGLSPGTIVKLTNPSNKKVIYAKVLGQMSGIRQNNGLSIRVCNAGATVLDVWDQDKFIVQISY
jgi:LysM repeat protein